MRQPQKCPSAFLPRLQNHARVLAKSTNAIQSLEGPRKIQKTQGLDRRRVTSRVSVSFRNLFFHFFSIRRLRTSSPRLPKPSRDRVAGSGTEVSSNAVPSPLAPPKSVVPKKLSPEATKELTNEPSPGTPPVLGPSNVASTVAGPTADWNGEDSIAQAASIISHPNEVISHEDN